MKTNDQSVNHGQNNNKPIDQSVSVNYAGTAKRNRYMLLLLIIVCASPVMMAYITYYFIKPKGGVTNYGKLIEPQRPIPDSLVGRNNKGEIISLQALTGKWLLVSIDASDCQQACQQKLYYLRQIRLAQNVESKRLDIIWLRTDNSAPSSTILAANPDLQTFVVDRNPLAKWLPATATSQIESHLYLIDPLGNLMMRFPASPEPGKIKRDITKLMKWSSTG